jgi:hypothetical protein
VQFRDLLNLLKTLPAMPTDERRSTVRLCCDIPTQCQVGGAICPATVVDVTLSGLGLELARFLQAKDVVTLARDDFGSPLQAEVLWSRRCVQGPGYRVGARYQTDQETLRQSWLAPALKQSGFKAEVRGEQRKLLRVPGRVACRLECAATEQRTEGEMLDLSLGGATIESALEFPKGQTLQFETVPLGGLPPFQGSAKVVSCRKRDERWRCGLHFSEYNSDYAHIYMRSMLASVWAGRG